MDEMGMIKHGQDDGLYLTPLFLKSFPDSRSRKDPSSSDPEQAHQSPARECMNVVQELLARGS